MRSSPPSSPTELAIRDYLYRLSTAARGRLSTEDRHALETRTREFIERTASELGPSSAMQFAAVLSRLGDPAALVDQEATRLAAERGDGGPAAQPGGRPRRRSGKPSWHWPTSSGSPDLQTELLNGAAAEPAENAEAFREPPIWVPREAFADYYDATTGGRPSWPTDVAMSPAEQASPVPAPVPEPADYRSRSGSTIVAAVLEGARDNKLEAVAVTVMGFAGAVYPPLWLLGAALAVASKLWDYRDKWLGLAGPVLLLVLGTWAGAAFGSRHVTINGYVHGAWIYADVLSRVAAALGAYYLAWRIGHPRQEPDVPPWNRPHKIG